MLSITCNNVDLVGDDECGAPATILLVMNESLVARRKFWLTEAACHEHAADMLADWDGFQDAYAVVDLVSGAALARIKEVCKTAGLTPNGNILKMIERARDEFVKPEVKAS